MNIPFAVLNCTYLDKRIITERLFEIVIRNKFVMVIVKSRISFIDLFRKNLCMKFKFKLGNIYIIDNILDINEGVNLLLKMKMWHKPVFHMMICKENIKEKIINLYKYKHITLDSIENALTNEVYCYIDPVDDQLEFYGSLIAENIIYEAFPQLQLGE